VDRPRVAVVIPALNEGATIGRVVRGLADIGQPIVVDDGSSDGTGAAAVEAGAVVVRHDTPRGYDAALESGFARAAALSAEMVVTCDADGQHRPESVRQAVDLLQQGFDLVVGIRPRPARIAEYLFALYTRLRFGLSDPLCGLKGYRIHLYEQHGRFDSRRSIGTELALASLRRHCRLAQFPIPIEPRASASRFGSSIRGNLRILRALGLAVTAVGRDS
jgi:glycosyltransferase involved in cell wall biosynthesis